MRHAGNYEHRIKQKLKIVDHLITVPQIFRKLYKSIHDIVFGDKKTQDIRNENDAGQKYIHEQKILMSMLTLSYDSHQIILVENLIIIYIQKELI